MSGPDAPAGDAALSRYPFPLAAHLGMSIEVVATATGAFAVLT